MISIEINGKTCRVPKDSTILDACRANNIYIPTICYHPDLSPAGKCGLCVVKIDESAFAYACIQKVRPGMIIDTNCQDVMEKVKRNYTNFIDMSVLPPSQDLENISEYLFPRNAVRTREFDRTNSIIFSPESCINCGRCIRMCSDIQNIGALNDANPRLHANQCISCGQCITVCPTPALSATSSISGILRAMTAKKTLVLQTAPSVRVAIGELFGEPVGKVCTEKMISAARKLGFNYVFDTNFGADVTIMEEGTELLDRLTNKGILPQFTSCCPAWVNWVEKLHSELIPNLSTTRSPHMIVGRLVKTYFASKTKIDPNDLYVVSLMPCVAKKDEIKRMQMNGSVDAVITTREFGEMIGLFGLDWNMLNHSEFDDLMGECTGGGAIFGVTGGVAEASIRFAHQVLTKEKLGRFEYDQWRGLKSIKTANVKIGGKDIKIAVCSGIAAATELVESGKFKSFHFIEVMACPCGCIAGAGQPNLPSKAMAIKRAEAIYQIDKDKEIKVCSDNPRVIELYNTYLGKPGSELAHDLLHTHYEPQETAILAKRKRMLTMPIVAYGTASGTSMRLARIVAGSIGSLSVSINSLSVNELLKRGTAIFVLSTIGDGEFPTNCLHFIEELRDSFDDLSTVKFAVAGLGSHNFRYFCAAGRQLHLLLEQHLAKPIMKFTEIDTASDDKGEAVFERWTFELCAALNFKTPRIGIKLMYQLIPTEETGVIKNPYRPITFEIADIKSRELLTSKDYEKSLYLIKIKLPRGMGYEPGNHIDVLPENPPELVDQVINVCKFNPDQVFKLYTNENLSENFLPERVSVRQLFSQYLDLSGKPNRSIMRAFEQIVNPEGLEKLTKLLDVMHEENFTEFVKDINTAEFILEFAKYGIPSLDYFVSSCPHIAPRIYSVATSPISESGMISLIVNLHTFGEQTVRKGLSTHYLVSDKTHRVPIRIRNGTFSFPQEKEAPQFFVAMGAGIAPVMSLIEHRKHIKGCGPAVLFLGCRNRVGYEKVIEMVEKEKEIGALTHIFYAFSRDSSEKKTYVQDVMAQNIELMWTNYWSDPKCQVFYSGPAEVVPDQIKEILLKATMKIGGLSCEEAMVYNKRHGFFIEAFMY